MLFRSDRLHGQRPAAYRMLGGGEEGRLETLDAQAVRRGALGKQDQVVAAFQPLAHLVAMLDGTMPPLALDKDGALQPRQQAEERPVIDLLLGDEAGRQRGRADDDVEPRDMVADEPRQRRGRTHTDLAPLAPPDSGTPAGRERE